MLEIALAAAVGAFVGSLFRLGGPYPEEIAERVVEEWYEWHDPDRIAERTASAIMDSLDRRERIREADRQIRYGPSPKDLRDARGDS